MSVRLQTSQHPLCFPGSGVLMSVGAQPKSTAKLEIFSKIRSHQSSSSPLPSARAIRASAAGPRLARSVNDAGKDLYVWTVDDPLDMSRLISMGADGLITNEPALVHQVLEVRAGLNTAERLILWMSERLGLQLNTAEYRDDQP